MAPLSFSQIMMRSQALYFMKNFRCLLIVKISKSDENIEVFVL